MLLEDILITAFLFVHLLGRLATYHLIQMKIDVTSGSHQEVRGIIETGTSDFNSIAVIIKEFEKARKSSNNTIFFMLLAGKLLELLNLNQRSRLRSRFLEFDRAIVISVQYR